MNKKIDTTKFAFWLLITMVSCFVISAFIFFQSGSFNNIINNKDGQNIDKTKLLKSDGVKLIKIDCDSSDIHIIPVDSSEIAIHLYGKTSKVNKDSNIKIDTKMVNDQLIISVKKPFTFGINLGFFTGLNLDVQVPKNYSSDISVNSSSGNVKIENFSLNNLNLHVSSGDVSINSLTSKDCSLDLSSGSAKLESFIGNLKSNSSSGDVSVDYKEFHNNIDASGSSGSFSLKLPENAEFYLNASASSGDINNEFPLTITKKQGDNKLEGTSINDHNKINIRTSSGDININK